MAAASVAELLPVRSRSTRSTSARGAGGRTAPTSPTEELGRARSPTTSGARLHPRRAAPGDGAPLLRLVGLPDDGLLRADRPLRARRPGFMAFVDTLHQRGIGVILDWVPSHFATDDFALGDFDGTHLYEHADPTPAHPPRLGELRVQLRAPRGALVPRSRAPASGCDRYHADGLRVDAVASMLYLDYSRRRRRVGAEPLRRAARTSTRRLPPRSATTRSTTRFPGASRSPRSRRRGRA